MLPFRVFARSNPLRSPSRTASRRPQPEPPRHSIAGPSVFSSLNLELSTLNRCHSASALVAPRTAFLQFATNAATLSPAFTHLSQTPPLAPLPTHLSKKHQGGGQAPRYLQGSSGACGKPETISAPNLQPFNLPTILSATQLHLQPQSPQPLAHSFRHPRGGGAVRPNLSSFKPSNLQTFQPLLTYHPARTAKTHPARLPRTASTGCGTRISRCRWGHCAAWRCATPSLRVPRAWPRP
jgi:hypothetical protein